MVLSETQWPIAGLGCPRGHLVVGAAARFQRQSAVGPELTLAAKTERSLHARDQQGRTNRSHKGNAAQDRRGRMFMTFLDQIAADLPTHGLQAVKLLEHALGAISLASLKELF